MYIRKYCTFESILHSEVLYIRKYCTLESLVHSKVLYNRKYCIHIMFIFWGVLGFLGVSWGFLGFLGVSWDFLGFLWISLFFLAISGDFVFFYFLWFLWISSDIFGNWWCLRIYSKTSTNSKKSKTIQNIHKNPKTQHNKIFKNKTIFKNKKNKNPQKHKIEIHTFPKKRKFRNNQIISNIKKQRLQKKKQNWLFGHFWAFSDILVLGGFCFLLIFLNLVHFLISEKLDFLGFLGLFLKTKWNKMLQIVLNSENESFAWNCTKENAFCLKHILKSKWKNMKTNGKQFCLNTIRKTGKRSAGNQIFRQFGKLWSSFVFLTILDSVFLTFLDFLVFSCFFLKCLILFAFWNFGIFLIFIFDSLGLWISFFFVFLFFSVVFVVFLFFVFLFFCSVFVFGFFVKFTASVFFLLLFFF